MLDTLRREYIHLVTSGSQLLLLLIGARFHSRTGWLVILGLIAALSLFAWISALRRLRMVRNTPTSRIASAAQGYVELTGRGKPLPESPVLSKLTALPCLWYRYRIERRDSENRWHSEDHGASDDPFVLEDDSGRCVIDPRNAEISTSHMDTWLDGDYRYTEWKLLQLDSLYAIGQFRTFGGSTMALDVNEEVKNVIAEWKQNMPDLLKRFDLNNDGQLDEQEWMLARQAAKREAAKRMAAERAKPDVSYLIQPEDGRMFLISNLSQDNLERRYLRWAWAHVVIFFSVLGGTAWLLSIPRF